MILRSTWNLESLAAFPGLHTEGSGGLCSYGYLIGTPVSQLHFVAPASVSFSRYTCKRLVYYLQGCISKSRCLQLYVTKNVNSFVLNQKDISFSSTKFRGDTLSHVSEVCRTQVRSSDEPVSFIIIKYFPQFLVLKLGIMMLKDRRMAVSSRFSLKLRLFLKRLPSVFLRHLWSEWGHWIKGKRTATCAWLAAVTVPSADSAVWSVF